MKHNKRFTIDLRTLSLFSPSCKCVELIPDLIDRGYDIKILGRDWNADKENGLTFDKKNNIFRKGGSKFLWDANVHPRDFYINLISSTFQNIDYIESNNLNKISYLYYIKSIFSPRYYNHLHYISLFMEKNETKRYINQKLNSLVSGKSVRSVIAFLYNYLNIKLVLKFKIKPKSKGFRYKLSPKLLDKNVKQFIKKAQNENTKYILILPNWDDDGKYEKQKDRLRGILHSESEFESMVNFVKEVDKYALKGKCKFILASKKAVDWPKIIKSNYLDLREFEKYGFTLSQTIYILQELTSMTINWPCTFSMWMTNCSEILHLTWCDNKDTAAWTRNNLHKLPAIKALSLIGIE